MNVLLTSVGRRAYMVKYFQEVLGTSGEVHVSNSDDKTVAFQYADHSVITPLIYDDAYIPFLLDYCKKNKIDILLSLFDIDLLILAKNKKKFEKIGTKVIVSEPEIVSVCNDKWKTYNFLKENGFNVPKTYLTLESVETAVKNNELDYPVIVKPRFGCGSISISVADNEEELRCLYKKAVNAVHSSYLKYESAQENDVIIFQECLNGQEYGADLINDLSGKNKAIVVRKKIAMRSGETDIAELVDEPLIKNEAVRLSGITRHIANMDTDWFIVDGVPYVLEMNVRFGGGYPFSHMGGCNLPEAIVKWCRGEEVSESILSVRTGIRGFKEIYITEV